MKKLHTRTKCCCRTSRKQRVSDWSQNTRQSKSCTLNKYRNWRKVYSVSLPTHNSWWHSVTKYEQLCFMGARVQVPRGVENYHQVRQHWVVAIKSVISHGTHKPAQYQTSKIFRTMTELAINTRYKTCEEEIKNCHSNWQSTPKYQTVLNHGQQAKVNPIQVLLNLFTQLTSNVQRYFSQCRYSMSFCRVIKIQNRLLLPKLYLTVKQIIQIKNKELVKHAI